MVRGVESLAAHVVGGNIRKIMAAGNRHNPEQIVRRLMTADRLLAEGKDTAAVCREVGVSEAMDHRSRNQFGGLKAPDAKRLKDLERENAALPRKRLVGVPRAQSNARRHISVRSAREIFCD